MSDDFEIHFEGLNELMDDFKKAEGKVPELGAKVLKKGMNKCKTLSKNKTPYDAKCKLHVKDKYKVGKVQFEADGMNIKMTNESPLFHLVERGHRIVAPYTKKELGYYAGHHMVERSMQEMDVIFPTQVEKMIKKILK